MQMIIDHPESIPLSRRVSWGCVTLACWGVWGYLWMPLITLAGWGLGFYQTYNEFRSGSEVIELKRLLTLYAIIVTAFGSTLLLWALSEYMRFRHSSRRAMPAQTDPQDLAAYTGLRVAELASWQGEQCLVAYHDQDGSFVGADVFGAGRRAVLVGGPG